LDFLKTPQLNFQNLSGPINNSFTVSPYGHEHLQQPRATLSSHKNLLHDLDQQDCQ